MLTRDEILKLQFINRCICEYDFKLLLDLHQIATVSMSPVDYLANPDQEYLDFIDYSQSKMMKRYFVLYPHLDISKEIELTPGELEYLVEQCEVQLRERKEHNAESSKNA